MVPGGSHQPLEEISDLFITVLVLHGTLKRYSLATSRLRDSDPTQQQRPKGVIAAKSLWTDPAKIVYTGSNHCFQFFFLFYLHFSCNE